jgi:AcrR family transcriptional regulator
VAPPAPRRRGRPSQITLEQVVDAAARLGLADLTVQAVADHLGVTRAAVYYYVSSTEELRRIAAHRLLPAFDVLAGDHATWQEWLRAFAEAGRRWRLANADLMAEVWVPMAELPSLLVVADEGIEVLVAAGFPAMRAAHAIQFVVGLVWINTHDEIVARSSPEGRHPQGARITQTVAEADLGLRHIPVEAAQLAFGDPDARFQRELGWAIGALEAELALSARPERRSGRSPR